MKNILYISGDSKRTFFEKKEPLKSFFAEDNLITVKPLSCKHINTDIIDLGTVFDYNVNHLNAILEKEYDIIIAVSRGCHYILECLEERNIKSKVFFIVPVTPCNRKHPIFPIRTKRDRYNSNIDYVLEVKDDDLSVLGKIKEYVNVKEYDYVDLKHNDTESLLKYLISKKLK